MAKGAKSTTRVKNARARTNNSKAAQAQKLQNAADVANEAVKVTVVMEQPAAAGKEAIQEPAKQQTPSTLGKSANECDYGDALKHGKLTPEQLTGISDEMDKCDAKAEAMLKDEQAQKAKAEAAKGDPEQSADNEDVPEELYQEFLAFVSDHPDALEDLDLLVEAFGQADNEDEAEGKRYMPLRIVRLISRYMDVQDAKATPNQDRIRNASQLAQKAFSPLFTKLAQLSANVTEALNCEDSVKQLQLLVKAVSVLPKIMEALDTFQQRYEVERKAASEIAHMADKLKQDVATLTRWAFDCKTEAGKRVQKAVKAVKAADADKAAAAAAEGSTTGTAGTGAPADGTDGANAPADGTDGANAPADGAKASADGTDGVKAPADGTDGANAPADGTDGAKAPADGTDGANPPADSTDGAKAPADGTDGANPPADSTDGAKAPADGTNGANAPDDGKSEKQAKRLRGVDLSADEAQHVRKSLAALLRDGKFAIARKVYHELTDAELICKNCGSKMNRNGWVLSGYTVKFIPPKFEIEEHYVQSAVCENCRKVREDGKRTTVKASYANEKLSNRSYLTASLGSFLGAYWGYYGIPKYRLQAMTAMMGFRINSSTMGVLLEDLRPWILPMYNLLTELGLSERLIIMDETSWHAMVYLKTKERRDCRVFAFVTDPKGGKPIRVYLFKPDRKAEHIKALVNGRDLILVTDGYQGYEDLEKVIHCLCWAHLRRKFYDALPKKAKNGLCTAKIGFEFCSHIILADSYLEERFNPDGNLDPEKKATYRQMYIKPLVDKFFLWCECVLEDKKGNENLNKAVKYGLNHKTGLCQFLYVGLAPLTSNLVENALRPIANLRKTIMHTGNDESSQLLMMYETLLQTAAINNLNPQAYLETYLTRMLELGKAPPKEELAKLLPWAKEMQDNVMHLDLPEQKPESWSEEKIAKHREMLYSVMGYAYSSRTLQKRVTQEEWMHIPWGEVPESASHEEESTETAQEESPEAPEEPSVTA
ncbi:IS66 family transposase [uncultured Mailhella sp.]|uniref:IS66 family transposase n=1 Tax=uncultured Mailhella sp. TaxID=1981031 RepID=UPI002602EED4|nr:IS66 family transposase [uncultured Mailhella sp.]